MSVALATATAIQWANAELIAATEFVIPIPPRLLTLLVGSSLLAFGTTVFEFVCPPPVKEYSRTRWVQELKRPGALYTYFSLQRPLFSAFAVMTVYAGALVLAVLFLERIVRAARLIGGW